MTIVKEGMLSLLMGSLFCVLFVPSMAVTAAEEKDEKKAEAKAEPEPKPVSVFPDKNLEAVVRKYVFAKRDNDEPITAEDVKDLSTIDHKWRKGKKVRGKEVGRVKDLTGLEKCRSLALLRLSDHEITDLKPVVDLKNIQSLDLSGNKIEDVSPLSGLVKLQYVVLASNQISDLTPLAKLENLRSLYVSQNKISDATAVGGLTKLWSLYLDGNQVSDITPLKTLKNLSSLDLRSNQVKDLSPLVGMTELRFLLIDDNKVSDISVLIDMAKKDAEKEKRFAPYWEVYLAGNLVKKNQVDELKKLVRKVQFTKKKTF